MLSNQITDGQNTSLQHEVTAHEIQDVIFSMKRDRSPGPDAGLVNYKGRCDRCYTLIL
jgi:hypothetical protein